MSSKLKTMENLLTTLRDRVDKHRRRETEARKAASASGKYHSTLRDEESVRLIESELCLQDVERAYNEMKDGH